ncbi:MAG: DUF2933 domain-containing protein [Rhizobiaceae bacterium]|nr:DUF2933 domain-containing protein [Rhizobiaceae bacterium]
MTANSLDRPQDTRPGGDERSGFWRSKASLVAMGFLLIGASVLLFEHRLHVLGYLPFALLLACPLLHLFLHRGHAHGGHHRSPARPRAGDAEG